MVVVPCEKREAANVGGLFDQTPPLWWCYGYLLMAPLGSTPVSRVVSTSYLISTAFRTTRDPHVISCGMQLITEFKRAFSPWRELSPVVSATKSTERQSRDPTFTVLVGLVFLQGLLQHLRDGRLQI